MKLKTIKKLKEEIEIKDKLDFSELVYLIHDSPPEYQWEEYFDWLELQATLKQTELIKKAVWNVINKTKLSEDKNYRYSNEYIDEWMDVFEAKLKEVFEG